MAKIEIKNLDKEYEAGAKVIRQLSLEIEDKSFTVILGPSGCGKSTLLRMIAGLEDVTRGHILMDGEDVTHAEAKDRDIAMVFQNYALYPHMDVFSNVEYSLKLRGLDKQERKERVMQALSRVQMEELRDRKPSQLSGGQQQRVALARAIVKEPSVFLMDEPLSNLDAKLRYEMRNVISSLHEELETTFIYVTHDQSEAMSLADDIVLLNEGEIQQNGSPQSLYTDPSNLFTARFIGDPPYNVLSYGDYRIAFRPEDVYLPDYDFKSKDLLELEGELTTINNHGSDAIYHFETAQGEIQAKVKNLWKDLSDIQSLFVYKDDILVFDAAGERLRDSSHLLDDLKTI